MFRVQSDLGSPVDASLSHGQALTQTARIDLLRERIERLGEGV